MKLRLIVFKPSINRIKTSANNLIL